MRVLVVEDERYLAEAIHARLSLEAISADIADDGAAALEAVAHTEYDVVLLDRDIPVIHGDEVCRRLSRDPDRPAILMLTAARLLDDKVDGLTLGADDYLAKPFQFPELIARLRALSRRRFSALPPILEAADVRLNPIRREVTRSGRFVNLTRKEFAVLEVLMREPGTVVSAERLLEKAWDENANPFTNSVKVTISTLRRKLGEPRVIETLPGAGYVIGRTG
ncbi:response regulator transcription factor [Microbacterium luteolum]|uniref:Response regulator transcription factor n=1 Tax=Microbacterium luteolum TaxID=69367 RepID=A0ABY7XRF6_MICLT|nr:response regulator transcription factor [Microbacterium luteolum]WDM44746.1 response regulator transcription factor [Microbacterium luteolum]